MDGSDSVSSYDVGRLCKWFSRTTFNLQRFLRAVMVCTLPKVALAFGILKSTSSSTVLFWDSKLPR